MDRPGSPLGLGARAREEWEGVHLGEAGGCDEGEALLEFLAVSPGKPTITSVVTATPGMAARTRSSSS